MSKLLIYSVSIYPGKPGARQGWARVHDDPQRWTVLPVHGGVRQPRGHGRRQAKVRGQV